MKREKILLGSLLVLVLCLTVSPAWAQTPDLGIWVGKWFKVTETFKGYFGSASGVQSHNNSMVQYYKVQSWDSDTKLLQILIHVKDPEWEAFPLDLYYIAGSNLELLAWSQGEPTPEMSYGATFYIKGTISKGALKSATLKSLGAYQWDYDYGDGGVYVGGMTVKGSLIPESKLPPDLPR